MAQEGADIIAVDICRQIESNNYPLATAEDLAETERLVKETGARWRHELREVDVLARLDGVEFGLILPGCALGEAVEVLDRVRASTPRGQTASAGVARWDGEEPAELLLARCQDALAAAKETGRNVTIPAD